MLVGGELTPCRVQNVATVWHTSSWITPKTLTGTIVANGFAASCHTADHAERQALYAPYLAWLSWFPIPDGSPPELGGTWYHRVFRMSALGKWVHEALGGVMASSSSSSSSGGAAA